MAKEILIVEDDPYVRRLYQRTFKFENYDVEMAESGKEGLEKAKAVRPALILLDVMMPGMDGIEVLKRLKADPETKEIPVVMLTVLSEEGTSKTALDLGAKGYICKADFTPEQVVAKVMEYL